MAAIRGRLRRDLPPRIAILIVIVVAAYFTCPCLRGALREWNLVRQPSWVGVFADSPEARTQKTCDIDTWLIHKGLVEAPSFRDTLRWWHGTWAGQVPFYRPISSYAFWVDWKLFGNFEVRYVLLSVLLHLMTVWQFTLLSLTIFRYFRISKPGLATLLSGLLFVDGLFALGVRQITTARVFELWKNMPESLVTLFFCLSLKAYVNRIVSSETADNASAPPVGNRIAYALRLASPTLWYLACCASKEAGILMPLLLIWLEIPNFKKPADISRRALLRMAPVAAALPLFVIVRTLSLRTVTGFRYGSNGSWSGRIADNLLGAAGADLRTGRLVPLMLGLCLTLAISLAIDTRKQEQAAVRRSRTIRSVILFVAFTTLTSLICNPEISVCMRPVIFLLQTSDAGTLAEALGIAIMLTGLVNVFRYRTLLGLFCYSWVLVTVVLLAFTPSAVQREYLVEGGFAMMIAAGWTTWRTAAGPTATEVV